ncbi:hypothetical protein OHC33_006337 [Knufia fluminis]|uniref:Uncharacterized protein n=1 Tax=Knufia fluminis TaxID=191047 RepID=A0AAN8I5D1_9EURO|nr:hypothetical protein OHC33_006337 [Knufia fluminis]
MKLTLLLTIAIATLTVPLTQAVADSTSYGGHTHDYPYCVALFPEEPCFRDAEWCYRNWRSVNGWPTRDVRPEESEQSEPESQNVTSGISFDLNRITECASLAESDPVAYRQCLALREVRDVLCCVFTFPAALRCVMGANPYLQDPGTFADKTLGLTPSSLTPTNTNHTLPPRSPRGTCCRFTTHCTSYLRTLDTLASYNAFETWKHTGKWTKSACCLMLWYRSCDGDHKGFPGVIEEYPGCSLPGGSGIEMDP